MRKAVKKETYYVSVDLYITAEDENHAEHLAIKRLNRIAEKKQCTPFQITDFGPCDDTFPG